MWYISGIVPANWVIIKSPIPPIKGTRKQPLTQPTTKTGPTSISEVAIDPLGTPSESAKSTLGVGPPYKDEHQKTSSTLRWTNIAGWEIHQLKMYLLKELVVFQPAMFVYRMVSWNNFIDRGRITPVIHL